MGFTIEFSPFQMDNNAQLITTAIIRHSGEILWSEQIFLFVPGDTTSEQIQELLNHRISGFSVRVAAILAARRFVGVIPPSVQG